MKIKTLIVSLILTFFQATAMESGFKKLANLVYKIEDHRNPGNGPPSISPCKRKWIYLVTYYYWWLGI